MFGRCIDLVGIDNFNTTTKTFNTSIKYNYNDETDKYEIKNYTLSYHNHSNPGTASVVVTVQV